MAELRRLMILRHGKAERLAEIGRSDFGRSLSTRGRKDVATIAERTVSYNLFPDLILASSARRAAQTADTFAETLGISGRTFYDAALYHADALELIKVINAVPQETTAVLLIGHNPSITELIHDLAGPAFPGGKIRTAAFAAFSSENDNWQNIMHPAPVLTHFFDPKNPENQVNPDIST